MIIMFNKALFCFSLMRRYVFFFMNMKYLYIFCNFQCHYLVVDLQTAERDTYKCRTAVKCDIPVVRTDFLHQCVEKRELLDADPFVVHGETKSQRLKAGKIPGL